MSVATAPAPPMSPDLAGSPKEAETPFLLKYLTTPTRWSSVFEHYLYRPFRTTASYTTDLFSGIGLLALANAFADVTYVITIMAVRSSTHLHAIIPGTLAVSPRCAYALVATLEAAATLYLWYAGIRRFHEWVRS
jgi:hypothetical protein